MERKNKTTYKKFSLEYKIKMIKEVNERVEISIAKVAKYNAISPHLLRRWVRNKKKIRLKLNGKL